MCTLINDLIHNLLAGLRLASFRRCGLDDFRFKLDQLVLLLLIDLALEAVSDYMLALPKPAFIRYALPTYTFNLACFFIAAYLIGKLLKRQSGILQVGVIIYSFAPVSIVCESAIHLSASLLDSWSPKILVAVRYLFSVYLIAVVFRALYIVSGRLKRFAVPSFLLLLVFLSQTQLFFSNYRDFWYYDESGGEEGKTDPYARYRALDAEALMYRQPEITARALAKLKPQRKKMTDVYFVGFAGYATEDVFSKEVKYAKQLLDRRFYTQGHSINLINHLDSIDEQPLATATNLSATLNRIGQLMDVENDVLILYLTSHGSRNNGLSVSFWPLALNDLSPQKLKAMLDRSGIKWRVVVVSACYSGIFVNALQNPTTLVATAAAADKTSFGCGTESEFTYFGEAVFKEQLTRQFSLISALRQASDSIGRRERREHLVPSMPQLSVGAQIETKLSLLSERLQRYQCKARHSKQAGC